MNKGLEVIKRFFISQKYLLPISIVGVFIFTAIKLAFYFFNRSLLHFDVTDSFTGIAKASLLSDANTILPATLLFCILLQIKRKKPLQRFISHGLIIYLTLALCLNVMDVFYYSFHNQKANADLLYVVDSPFRKLMAIPFYITIAAILGMVLFFLFSKWIVNKSLHYLNSGNRWMQMFFALAFLGIYSSAFSVKRFHYILPYYGLSYLSSDAVTVSQNSMHTFLSSVVRGGEALPQCNYFTAQQLDSIYKNEVEIKSGDTVKKNIVLFIMESVPYDFFNNNSPYKVDMPCLDSLRTKSSFFTNAFCYSHISNKGIVAVLGSLPTITEIPIYHTSYIGMKHTKIGSLLKEQNYSSIFCIGDGYDDFGFAKCANWLGLDKYYCRNDIPNYKQLPSQPFGLHDEYVLEFMRTKIDALPQPFFATNFNISTHHDYELPKHYKKEFDTNYTSAMKAMSYYDNCLGQFFEKAKKAPWFKNTVFVFCPDHWMYPNSKAMKQHLVNNYRIPIMIYDPSNESPKQYNYICSQFDIMPTILSKAGVSGSFSSFGKNLFDSAAPPQFAFTKISNQWYQIVDGKHALGYDAATQKTTYLFDYSQDSALKRNVINLPQYKLVKDSLTMKIKAALQRVVEQYGSK